jgi:hypothetical protein
MESNMQSNADRGRVASSQPFNTESNRSSATAQAISPTSPGAFLRRCVWSAALTMATVGSWLVCSVRLFR